MDFISEKGKVKAPGGCSLVVGSNVRAPMPLKTGSHVVSGVGVYTGRGHSVLTGVLFISCEF